MSWPGTDPFYNYNTTEAEGRRGYYGVNGVPAEIVDGVDAGWPWDPGWGNAILSRANVPPDAEIDVTGYFDIGSRTGSIAIGVDPLGTISGNYVLQLVLVENDLYYMGSNGYPDHHAVMRDMIPSANGTSITLTAGSTTITDFDFSVADDIVIENAKLIIFVQNQVSKDVLNTAGIPVLSIVADCDNELGDIIDFGAINVQDLVKLVSIIIGTDTGSDHCQLAAADLNEDGNVNVQDIVLLVEMILG